jgi:sugar-specific transcriptional regulator TrmB
MNAPRTAREALIAEMLGEMEELLVRVEKLPAVLEDTEKKVANTVAALEGAGDKYRQALTAFNEEAKVELTSFLERKAAEIASKTAEEQRAVLQDEARRAVSDKVSVLGPMLEKAAREVRQSTGSRLAEHAITAFIASGTTAGLIYMIATTC